MGRMSPLGSGFIVAFCAALAFGLVACNEHPVTLMQATGDVEVVVTEDLGGGEQIDILWMIDNSGSMCRSQGILREGIDDFVNILDEVNIDFHIGVTTSHMLRSCEYYEDVHDGEHPHTWWACNFEPVAEAGRLQATPQPIPGPDPRCNHPVDPVSAEPIEDDLTPLLDTMETAFGCLENPDDWAHLWPPSEFSAGMQWESEAEWELELRCALDGEPGLDPGDCTDVDSSIEDFFPDPDAEPYRDIPLVLRSEDYQVTEDDVVERDDLEASDIGSLDIEGLRADFACMSLVGTRGFGFERGLDAVNLAVSPELTGGPSATFDDRDEFPNAGFLRSGAQTGVVYISDENDCSHDGDLDILSACGVHECTIQEHRLEQGLESHITPVEDLYEEFLLNLTASQRELEITNHPRNLDIADVDTIDELGNDDHASLREVTSTVLPASVHGRLQHLGEIPVRIPDSEIPVECPEDSRPWTDLHNWEVPESCITEMGRAWSGHRYSQFLAHFDTQFPDADDDGDVPGQICTPFGDTLEDIALFFQSEVASCLDEVYACSGLDDICPPSANPVPEAEDPDAPGYCTPYPVYNEDVADAVGSLSGADLSEWSDADLSTLEAQLGGTFIHYALDDLDIEESMREELFDHLEEPLADDDVFFFCDTGIEVRLSAAESDDLTIDTLMSRTDSAGELYCIEGSDDNSRFPDTCVVHPDRYTWVGCEDDSDGLLLSWNDESWDEHIGAYSLVYRYATRAIAEDDADDDNGDDDNGDDD